MRSWPDFCLQSSSLPLPSASFLLRQFHVGTQVKTNPMPYWPAGTRQCGLIAFFGFLRKENHLDVRCMKLSHKYQLVCFSRAHKLYVTHCFVFTWSVKTILWQYLGQYSIYLTNTLLEFLPIPVSEPQLVCTHKHHMTACNNTVPFMQLHIC